MRVTTRSGHNALPAGSILGKLWKSKLEEVIFVVFFVIADIENSRVLQLITAGE